MMVLLIIFYFWFFSLRRSEERDGSCAGALSFVEPWACRAHASLEVKGAEKAPHLTTAMMELAEMQLLTHMNAEGVPNWHRKEGTALENLTATMATALRSLTAWTRRGRR